jgi:hypothetical protein
VGEPAAHRDLDRVVVAVVGSADPVEATVLLLGERRVEEPVGWS